MKTVLDMLQHQSRATALSDAERLAMRESLISYINQKPLNREIVETQKLSSLFSTIKSIFGRKTVLGVLAVCVLLVGGASASIAAEKSLPGESLYVVKTGFNERIKTWSALSPAKRVGVELHLANRRVAEAEILYAQNNLSDEAKRALGTSFKKHATNVTQGIKELTDQGKPSEALNANLNLMAIVQGHSAIVQVLLADDMATTSLDKK